MNDPIIDWRAISGSVITIFIQYSESQSKIESPDWSLLKSVPIMVDHIPFN
jgi:hypothetical protein